MSIEVFAPERAPARTDLPYLRHRSRPRSAAQPARPAGGSASLDLSTPARPVGGSAGGSASLDLSSPARPAGGSASLDLSTPARPTGGSAPATRPAGNSSLDLSAPAPAAAPAAPAANPPARRRPSRPLPRARSGERTLLTPKAPTVTLTRLQSGIGALSIEAACSPAVGDLRIGAAYQLADGHSSLVARSLGISAGPRDSRRPVILARAEQYERLLIDLRQNRQLERLVVFAFSESGGQLNWGGTLVTSTAGGARVELPLERPASGGVMVLLSIYNVHGEFVVRAEMETIPGPVRAAVGAYGFDRISWLDDRTPVA